MPPQRASILRFPVWALAILADEERNLDREASAANLGFLRCRPSSEKPLSRGFRRRVAVLSDPGPMPWSDIELLQDLVRETEDALERARADFRAEQMKLGR